MTDQESPAQAIPSTMEHEHSSNDTSALAPPPTTSTTITTASPKNAAVLPQAVVIPEEPTATATATAAPAESNAAQMDAIEPVSSTVEGSSSVTPLTEGVLGYKAPGLVKSLRFVKRFFWFGDAAVPVKDLHLYLRGEKPENAHHNLAWSSQTGKGLLYYAKQVDQKSTPAGILNLADVVDVVKDGQLDFHFKLHGQKHTFQAATISQRDDWVKAIQQAATEAKASIGTITSGAGYKEQMEHLALPAAIATTAGATTAGATTAGAAVASSAIPKKSTDKAPETLKKDEAYVSSSDDGLGMSRRKQKSRSASRKRTSLFGSFLGKKEDHDEKKVERKEEHAAGAAPTAISALAPTLPNREKAAGIPTQVEPTTVEPTTASLDRSLDAVAVAERVVAAPVTTGAVEAQAVTTAKEDVVTVANDKTVLASTAAESTTAGTARDNMAKSKRNSFFGSFFQRRETSTPTEEKKEKDLLPLVAAKEAEPVVPAAAIAAPVPAVERVISSEPATTSAVPVSMEPNAAGTSKEKTGTPKESFFGKFMKQEKGKHQEKKEEKADVTEKAVPSESLPVSAATTSVEPAAHASAAVENGETSAPVTPAGALKEKRRTSFFGTFAARKEKRGELAAEGEHAEAADATSKAANASPLPKLGGLFRKPSKAANAHLGSGRTEATAPVLARPATETAAAAESSSTVPHATAADAGHGLTANGAIGDVVPTTVTHSSVPVDDVPAVQAIA
ncbi:MAG: hypothetical protein M1826_000608 [Phylliscum demangeonii]|nr:MAG: hypothetical protein M1826_000608 [Phylliscum demangeonii]